MRIRLGEWQLMRLWVVLATGAVLAGCANAPPTPTPLLPAPDLPTEVVGGLLTPARTTIPAPHLTQTPRSTLAPTPSPTAMPTSTLTPSPTSTPGPTLQPGALLETALLRQTNGDYDQAITAYLDLLAGSSAPEQVREASYHLAESYLLNHEYLASAVAWEEFLTEFPNDERLPQATLMAARALHAANEYASAIPYYRAYLAHEIVLADMVYEWIGDCHAAMAASSADPDGELEQVIAAYGLAVDAASDPGVRVSLLEKIAGVYLARGDYDAAVAQYDAILEIASIDYYRAKIEFLAGQALTAAGQVQEAYARYHRAVDSYPEAEYAYFSLIELVDAGVPVDEFQRGLVDFFAGATYPEAYGAAIRAFDRYLAAEPAEGTEEALSSKEVEALFRKADEALYRKGLAQRALEQPEAALETFELLIAGYPDSEWLPPAWLEKGAILVWMGDNDSAVKTYRDLAAFFPSDDLAPKALWRAAMLYDSTSAYSEAASLYENLQYSFPAFERADEALWRAGLAHYRDGSQDKAIATWQSLLEKYPDSSYRGKSLYWLGKLTAASEAQENGYYWDQVLALDPYSYYALRIRQIRSGESLTATRLSTAPVKAPAWDMVEAQTTIEDWLQDWLEVPPDTDLASLPAALTQRSDFQRGEALLSIGLRREALDAFDGVRAAVWADPLALTQLSLFFREQGMYGLAARCAARSVGLWPGGLIHDAPLPVQRLAYPLAYEDLLSAEAQRYGLDPLLLAALIRQESLFEPVAESYAGARGLGQVMPATGEGIARSLDVDDFYLDDLYRPSVSIRFAAFYLSAQMRRFDDQILVALAAYNGGPGNTLRWLEDDGDDLDLFVEVITASQSRLYLQRVYEHYITYETLYETPGIGQQLSSGDD